MRRVAKNILFVLGGDVFSRLLGFFATIWLARVLGTEGFGSISFAFTFLGYAFLLSDLGLTTLGTREVAKTPHLCRSYIAKIISLRSLLAIAAFAVIVTLSFLVPALSEVRPLIIFYSISVIPYALSVEWFFRGIEEMKYIGLSSIIAYSCYLLPLLLFVRSIKDINLVPLFWLLGSVLSVLFLWWTARRRLRAEPHQPSPIQIDSPNILKRALPIAVGTIMTHIYFNFDITMLGFIRGTEEAGLYTAVYKLLMFLLLLDRVLVMVLLPIISKHYNESKERLKQVLSTVSRIIIMLVIPISAGGTLLALPITQTIYGKEYIPSVPVFQILVWVLTIGTIGSIYTQGLIASGQEKRYGIVMLIGTSLNIVLNLIMIPTLGIIGSAVATVCSEIVMVFLMYRAFSRVVKVQILPYTIRPIFASVVMCLVLYLLEGLNPGLLIFIGAIIYFFLVYIMGSITRDDIRLVMGNGLKVASSE